MYGNSNTVYSGGVRAVTAYPPPAAGYLLYYGPDQAHGYAPIIHKKIMCGILYLVCAMVCIDYRYIKYWYFNDCILATIPIIYIIGNDAVYVYIVCIVNLFDRFGLHLVIVTFMTL